MTRLSRARTALSLLPLLLVLLSACQPRLAPEQKLLQQTGERVILPSLQTFSDRSARLASLSEGFCRQPQATALDNLRGQWRQTMNAWQAVRLLNFGPINDDNQAWKIQFWPDKKNLIGRKVEALLASDAPVDSAGVARAGVLVRGLSALEYLLFDSRAGQLQRYQPQSSPAAGQGPARQCQLLQAAAQLTHEVAAGLQQAWSPEGEDYLGVWTAPGADNPHYPDSNAAVSALVDALVTAAETAKNRQLGQPMGYATGGDRPRPFLAEAWRSQHSSAALAANLGALANLYRGADGYGLDDYLRELGHESLANRLDSQLQALAAAASAAPDLSVAATAVDARAPLAELFQLHAKPLAALKRELPAALGVKLGFNSNDGD